MFFIALYDVYLLIGKVIKTLFGIQSFECVYVDMIVLIHKFVAEGFIS